MIVPHEDFAPADLAIIERETHDVGRYVFERLSRARPSVLDRRWWDDQLMQWAMGDDAVKVQMFRFVDVLPMLSDSQSVVRHLHEYFDDVSQQLPSAARLGLSAVRPHSLAGRALAIAARRNVLGQARRFIAGTTVDEVLAATMRQRKLRRAFTIDVLGEAVTSEVEAEAYLDAYLDLIRRAGPIANCWPEVPQIDRGVMTALPRVNVSVKLSALDSRFDPLDRAGTTQRVGTRLRQLLREAREQHAFVNVDMESYETKDLVLHIFQSVLAEEEFRDVGDVGIVLQCYLRDSAADAMRLRDWARQRGKPVWVRLVKGAYWDYETTHARAIGWPVPVYEHKAETDANFERITRFVLRNHHYLRPAIGSHNVRSIAHAIAVARQLGLPPTGLELQMLYGMGDQEKDILVGMGYRMRVYMPYGELIPGMAYLVRRLLENTSNDSFLRASFTEHVSPERLLMNPHNILDGERHHDQGSPTGHVSPADSVQHSSFTNEPPSDFARAEVREAMQAALDDVQSQFGRSYPLRIGNQWLETKDRFDSLNPPIFAR